MPKRFPKWLPRMRALLVATAAAAFTLIGVSAVSAAEAPKDATPATKAANAALLKKLPFGDKQAFKDAHKGFIAPLPRSG